VNQGDVNAIVTVGIVVVIITISSLIYFYNVKDLCYSNQTRCGECNE